MKFYMDNVCKICNQIVKQRKHYWFVHKIKEVDYYCQYEPKFDLWDKSLIPFKSPDSYLLTDFISKPNLKKYIESKSKEEPSGSLSWISALVFLGPLSAVGALAEPAPAAAVAVSASLAGFDGG